MADGPTMPADSVAGLIDFPLPPEVSLWPQTWEGRLAIVVLMVITIAGAWSLMRYRRVNRYRREAMSELKRIERSDGASPHELLAGLILLVRRTALAGYVTNLALRKGARVANLPLSPVMAFIDTSNTLIGVEIDQIDARYVAPGQEVEIAFKFLPGRVYIGTVETVLQALSTGQAQTSGTAVAPKAIEAAPFVVRVKLDDDALAAHLPAGATGTAAIFTDHVKVSHIIRRVLLRQVAILNYVNPF